MDDYIKREDVIPEIDKAFENAEMGKTAMTKMLLSAAQLTVRSILRDMPAADVFEVVRCKDCKHKPYSVDGQDTGFSVRHPDDDERCPCLCMDGWYSWIPDDDFYCGYGERKTDMRKEVQEDG